MKKGLIYLLALLGSILLFQEKAFAVCPVCTVAVGAGVGLARWLKIDDTISGLWIGGLIVSLIFWTVDWLKKKNLAFKGSWLIVTLSYYLIVILPLYFKGIIGHPQNSLFCWCGIRWDKFVVGIILGSVSFYLGALSYFLLKKENQGHAYFPFQKVVMPILPLIILSLLFYFALK